MPQPTSSATSSCMACGPARWFGRAPVQNYPAQEQFISDKILNSLKPVSPGDTITATVTVKEKRPEKHIVLLDTICTNQHGVQVLSGTATVIAPATTIEWHSSEFQTFLFVVMIVTMLS